MSICQAVGSGFCCIRSSSCLAAGCLLAKLGLRTMFEDVVTLPYEMRVHDAFSVQDLQRARHVRGDPGWCRTWSMLWTSTAMVNECASVKMLGSGSCITWSSSSLVAGLCHARGLSASFQDTCNSRNFREVVGRHSTQDTILWPPPLRPYC